MPEAVISREDVVKVIGKVKSVAVCTEEANAYLACMQASKADSTKCKVSPPTRCAERARPLMFGLPARVLNAPKLTSCFASATLGPAAGDPRPEPLHAVHAQVERTCPTHAHPPTAFSPVSAAAAARLVPLLHHRRNAVPALA